MIHILIVWLLRFSQSDFFPNYFLCKESGVRARQFYWNIERVVLFDVLRMRYTRTLLCSQYMLRVFSGKNQMKLHQFPFVTFQFFKIYLAFVPCGNKFLAPFLSHCLLLLSLFFSSLKILYKIQNSWSVAQGKRI